MTTALRTFIRSLRVTDLPFQSRTMANFESYRFIAIGDYTPRQAREYALREGDEGVVLDSNYNVWARVALDNEDPQAPPRNILQPF